MTLTIPRTSLGSLACFLVGIHLFAQETPRPNRSIWMALLPDPLPEGRTTLTFEASSQFLRPDWERTADRRTFARMDGEEYQLTADLAQAWGPGTINLRIRLVDRSGGMLDQAIASWHNLLGTPGGGREQAPKYRLAYHLERDGRVIADLRRPGQHLMDVDLAYVLNRGTQDQGWRVGAAVQLPSGNGTNFSGNGAPDYLVGVAAWRQWGRWKVHGQAEHLWVGAEEGRLWHRVLTSRNLKRAWLGLGYQGTGMGLLSGLGLDLTLAYMGSPFQVNIPRVDRAGWQQHWTFTHRRLPRWRFGFSEEAGTYTTPDITAYVEYRF